MKIKILTGVPVYCMDENNSVAEAVVIVDDKIDYVGTTKKAVQRYPQAERLQLQKGAIFPGFIDAHIHLMEFSSLFRDADFLSIDDEDEVKKLIADKLKGRKAEDWLIGGGLTASLMETMTRKDLDEVSPYVPVLIYSKDLHSVITNSVGLDRMGIDESHLDPIGGRIERDAKGIPTGVFRERAIELFASVVMKMNIKTKMDAIRWGIDRLLSMGITTICDCSVPPLQPSMPMLMRLQLKDLLAIRVVTMFGEKDLEGLARMGITSFFGSEKVRIGGLKIILDGTLSSLTGYMKHPYHATQSYGIVMYNEEDLHRILRNAYSSYIWTAIHAIGDGANELALNVYERIIQEPGIPRLLRRIEHAQSITDEDIQRFADLDVIAVMNPLHIPLDRERALKHLGDDARFLYRIGSLMETGANIAFASDAPVAFPDPLHAIYCAVERRGYDDPPQLRFFPKEHISIIDALRAHTITAAGALGMEEEIGSIEVGKKADMIQLSKDILTEGISVIRNTEVLMTMVTGEVVYQKE